MKSETKYAIGLIMILGPLVLIFAAMVFGMARNVGWGNLLMGFGFMVLFFLWIGVAVSFITSD